MICKSPLIQLWSWRDLFSELESRLCIKRRVLITTIKVRKEEICSNGLSVEITVGLQRMMPACFGADHFLASFDIEFQLISATRTFTSDVVLVFARYILESWAAAHMRNKRVLRECQIRAVYFDNTRGAINNVVTS